MRSQAARIASARVITLILSAGLNLVLLAWLSRTDQVLTYALYAVLASFLFLVPFSDLGLGAGVLNWTTDLESGQMARDEFWARLVGVLLVVTALGSLVAVASAVVYVLGVWDAALGNVSGVSSSDTVAMITGLVVGLCVPLGIGARILQGLGRTDLAVKAGILGPVVQVMVCGFIFLVEMPVAWVASAPAVGFLAVNAVSAWLAARLLMERGYSRVGGMKLDVRLLEFRSIALPFFVISLGNSLSIQSHRIILAHAGSSADLVAYSIAAQFVAPWLSIITLVGQSLWPKYRSRGGPSVRLLSSDVLKFFVAGVVAAATVVVAGPPIASVLTGDTALSYGVAACAGLYIIAICTHQPLGMRFTDKEGLWLQARLLSVSAPLMLAGVLFAAGSFGAGGVFLVTAVAYFVFQSMPLAFRVARM